MNSSTPKENKLTSHSIQLWFFCICGVLLFLYSLSQIKLSQLNLDLLIISLITIILGSKVAIHLKSIRTTISIADVFVYLAVLLYGAEIATILAFCEAYISSAKFTKKLELNLFNAGSLAISIFVASQISNYFFGSIVDLTKQGITGSIFAALVTIVCFHYLINTFIIAKTNSSRLDKKFFSVWREYYVWVFVPFLASGSIALVTANAILSAGILSFLLILPIVGIIYFGYQSQNEKLEVITEKAQLAEKHLQEIGESEERFRSAFSNAPIGMALINIEGSFFQINQSFSDIFCFSEEELLSKKIHQLLYPEDLHKFHQNTELLLKGELKSYQAELRYINNEGKEIWTQTSISPANGTKDNRLICQIQDISARRKAEEQLRYEAFNDSLTGLANRNSLILSINSAIQEAKNTADNSFCLMFVDIDRFKLINDTAGHSVGDKLLFAVSQRLKKCVNEKTTLARFGGDEFLILIQESLDENSIVNLVKEIQTQIGMKYVISGHEINLTVSVGVISYDEQHNSAEDILRDADTALHIAKKLKSSRYVIFDQEMREKAQYQMQLEKDLHNAVENQEFYLVYQPILSLSKQKLVGFEALIRWNHPKFGFVSPLEFISLAEENGTIVKIGNFVLDEACRQLKTWNNVFEDVPLTMSVNVSAKQLLHRQFFVYVLETLEKHKIQPKNLKLEITESVVVENTEIVLSILKQLRAIGVNLSMDDFGTGYSSLSYLHQLPIDTLKIDRSFVNQINIETESNEIVKTIILLAKNLNLDVVAEGIETTEQNQVLCNMLCNFGQGYLFAKPLSVTEATAYIKDSNLLPSLPILNEVSFQSDSISH